MTQPEKIASGAFADVWDLKDGTIIKAFRSESRAHGPIVDIRDHDLLTSVFCDKEIIAYATLKEIDNVKDHIPIFYGQRNPCGLLPVDEDVYVKGAGFIIEKLEGKDQKIAHLPQEAKNVVEPILWILSECLSGLNVWDSSCFFESDTCFKVIDFALWDSSSDYECHLFDQGRLNEEQKCYLQSLTSN